MFERALIVAAALMTLGAGAAEAQDWRTVTSFRQRSAEDRLAVHVRYGAGRLVVGPSAAGSELYRVGLRYDSELFEPITEYSGGRLEVGVEGTGRSIRLKNHHAGKLDLRLSPDVPLDLALAFGAVEADIDLSGLRIRSLKVETGASETDLRFSTPNAEPCARMEVSVGAASFAARGLGNANCAAIRLEGGVGDMTLDFSGEWRQSMEARIEMALGSVTLVVPPAVGVRVHKETFLAGFDGARFEKRDGVLYSENWETARHRLSVDVSGAFGSINVRWRN
ncbi:MAG TPA: hypothetical protein VMM12_16730 [Longimicrobiales bacterium]|nr:hypothetical protein [Longimicrobiales bacterium]